MTKRLFARSLFVLSLCAMIPFASAQESEEACSSKEIVISRVTTTILDEPSATGVRVRDAKPEERLNVLRSLRQGPWCWLQISEGWIIDSSLLLSVALRDTDTDTADSASSDCFQRDKAYVIGAMNIRAGSSTRHLVVANARAGDVFAVSASMVGSDWCWLKIDMGWLANTSRVRSTEPAQPVVTGSSTSATSQPSNIDNCCFVNRQCTSEQEWINGYWAYQRNECPGPAQSGTSSPSTGGHAISIEGASDFVRLMSEALDLLRARSQAWYNYVVSGIDRLIEDERSYTMAALPFQRTVLAAPYRRLIAVPWEDYPLNEVRVASRLVHEACHIHRHEAGFVYGPYTKVAEEVACIQNEKDMLSLAFPKYSNEHGFVGTQHCEGSLENHPRCQGFDVCEWSADRSKIISCPEIGLTRPSS